MRNILSILAIAAVALIALFVQPSRAQAHGRALVRVNVGRVNVAIGARAHVFAAQAVFVNRIVTPFVPTVAVAAFVPAITVQTMAVPQVIAPAEVVACPSVIASPAIVAAPAIVVSPQIVIHSRVVIR